MHRLIFGCGYLGLRIARQWLEAGDRVSLLTRSSQRAEGLSGEGFFATVGDVTHPASLRFLTELPPVDTLLYAVGFDRSQPSGPSIEQVYAGGLQNVLNALPDSTDPTSAPQVIYISTTGVYGDSLGGWVDEQTPPAPCRAGGKASLAAEQVLRRSPLADRSVVLRLAGLYGPGRLPYLRQLELGEPIEANPTGYLNLIHVDDAAAIIQQVASQEFAATSRMASPTQAGPLTYCVSDGHPVVRQTYYQEIVRQLGAPAPRFLTPTAGSPRAARALANKRIRNTRLLANMNFRLRYPSYREGLSQVLGQR